MAYLDSLDRKILYELDRNSRQNYFELAKKVKAKKDTVKYRIERMIKNRLITGFYTVIDYSKFGFMSFRLYIKLSDIPLLKIQELVEYLKNHKNVTIFYRTTGNWDFTLSVWMRDIWGYEVFWNDLTERFGCYFLDYHLALKTKYTEFSRSYLYQKQDEEKKQFTILQKTEKFDLDTTDFKILTALSKNARCSLVDTSKKCGISVVTCRSRIKSLIKKKIIIGFRAVLDYEMLGYRLFKVDIWIQNMKKKQEIMEYVLSHPNVTYVQTTIITSDIEFDIEVEGILEFTAVMDQIRKCFPNDIKRYEYYMLIENYKINYLSSL
ncbi:winged helix-turn-helix transcriptional regulator [Candidatus Micrarchaeota archaeon]|nr:winged helix-turn-helix transcriptional regulator [Candidatus Micrarchaeota archaeon]MBU1166184.1 winged helix-turn-helix transcriptional regulator [Candidatus Micrarchaeota archaeon]MBU1886582.1 winged helix-turn-helix transcriptional regulator [Candidatus Micrarchaeota archaeon]